MPDSDPRSSAFIGGSFLSGTEFLNLKGPFRLFLLAALLLAGGVLLVRALIVTDAKRVERLVEQGRRSVVRRDRAGVMSVVAPSYHDDFGMDYSELEHWFDRQFRAYDSIACRVSRVRPVVARLEAVCSLNVSWAGYARGRRVPGGEADILDGYPFYASGMVLYLHKYEKGWRVTGASP